MNMITVYNQNRTALYGCTSFYVNNIGTVRGATEGGWEDLGEYESKEKAMLVLERIFGVFTNGGRYFHMPDKDTIIGRWV